MGDQTIIIDARPLRYYPDWIQGGFSGGTEIYARQLAVGLSKRGYTVHVLTELLEHERQFGPSAWLWGPNNHPQVADAVIAFSTLETIGDLSAPLLVLAPNGIDPLLLGRGDLVDAVACFSECHIKLLEKVRPDLAGKCYLTGLGVDLGEYPWPRPQKPVQGRMLFSNDPARGLLQTLDVFDAVKKAVPEATLHIAYDFNRQFEQHKWSARCMAEILWECKRRIEDDPAIVSLGGLTHADLLREQYETQVHTYPSDPPNTGSQVHGMLQMELAAAGVPLVLSDIEAFPEIFGAAATLLPVIGRLGARAGNDMVRVDAQDWADVTVELMKSPKKWKAASQACRRLAERHTWDMMCDRFEAMLAAHFGQEAQPAAA